MSVSQQNHKALVYQALKHKNYFDCGKKDSLGVLENAEDLEDVIIQVERKCNVDQLLFRYNPSTHKFHRIALTSKDEELLQKEKKYTHSIICNERQCFSHEIDVYTFIKLLQREFEPIAVYPVYPG